MTSKVDIFADWLLNISCKKLLISFLINPKNLDIRFSDHNRIISTISDAPNVELVLGKSISAESIYEGGDAYFDCK